MGKFYEQALAGDIGPVMAVDPWAWVYYNKLILNSGPYKVDGHEFQPGILEILDSVLCKK